MIGLMWRQLRHGGGRTFTLAAGICVAAVAFSLLTATITTSQATVLGTVERNLRPAYDILVRPASAVSQTEHAGELVNDNFLAGLFGGITLDQYQATAQVSNVDVAAPIAMIGYVLQTVYVPVDITPVGGGDQLYRLTVTRTADRGNSVFPTTAESYAFVTSRQLVSLERAGGVVPGSPARPGTGPPTSSGPTLCLGGIDGDPDSAPAVPPSCGPFTSANGHISAYLRWTFPVLLAAIDPAAEDRLDQLGGAVTGGRYLASSDRPTPGSGATTTNVPVLVSSQPYVDEQAHVSIDQLDPAYLSSHAGQLDHSGVNQAVTDPKAVATQTVDLSADQAYAALLSSMVDGRCCLVDAYWTTEPTAFNPVGPMEVAAMPVTNPSSVWSSSLMRSGRVAIPTAAVDTGFRRLTEHVAGAGQGATITHLNQVGVFDPSRLAGFDQTVDVPLQTYNPPVAAGADAGSRAALHDQALLPNSNPAGYLQQTPLMLTTLDAIPTFGSKVFSGADLSAPISAIRVRVANLHGSVREQLDQVAQVALRIQQATGLEVDITAGSSSVAMTVDLPAGAHGRPDLRLSEKWVSKGVGLLILDSVDRKSLALFVLVLITTALFLTNGVYAAVRARRREIGVLRALGWRRAAIFRLIVGEVTMLGLLAGVVGSGLSLLLISFLSLRIPLDRALLVTPVAMVLAALAGAVPAWRAANGRPLDVMAPAVSPPRRAATVRGLTGLALVNMRRMPGRTILSALAVAIGIAALTALLSVDERFGATVGGSALAGLVRTQVRGVDYLSAGLAIGLGAVSVADMVYLGLKERASELAVLLATGWRQAHLARIALVEGTVTAVIGGGTGAVAGLLAGARPALAAVAALAGIGVVLLATRLMLFGLTRLPLVATLAEEE